MWLQKRTKLLRKRTVHRFRIFYGYYFKKRTLKEPVFVICERRTGSNMLLSCLNSIPGAFFAGEILNKSMHYGLRRRFISKKSVLRHLVHSIHHCEQDVCGAKLVRTQMEAHGIGPSHLKALFPNARFIILYRKSLLDQFVSLKIAEMTDAWQWTRGFKMPSSLRISLPEFERYCQKTKAFYEELFRQDWLGDCSLVLSYEDLAGDAQDVFEESVFPFLKLPVAVVQNGLIKQNTRDLRELIENYEEIELFVHHPSARQEYPTQRRASEFLDQVTRVA